MPFSSYAECAACHDTLVLIKRTGRDSLRPKCSERALASTAADILTIHERRDMRRHGQQIRASRYGDKAETRLVQTL